MTGVGSVLVTGPTGTVGAPLVDLLPAAGVPTVAGANRPSRYSGAQESRTLDFERPETFPDALAGIDRVFLMRPSAISDTKRYLRPFLEMAADRGVRHVVFLSVMGVNRVMPHWQVEQDLKSSPMTWTFLRPSFFAQNLQTAYGDDIRRRSQIRLASGNGRTSFIDTRDVAAVAALALREPSAHANRIYTLTGPQALDYHHVASMLSAQLQRPITYEPLTLLACRKELLRQGLPSGYVTVQLLINVVARLGLAAKTTDTVEQLLTRPPTDLATYLREYRNCWLDSSGDDGDEGDDGDGDEQENEQKSR